jgi:hypothetical protein
MPDEVTPKPPAGDLVAHGMPVWPLCPFPLIFY